ncbi:MAG: hypothetical protein RMK29_11355 [Myxococcales bacterium]|nr:hypothetical protein [Myxococcota bacterium]MDW8282304.1 hypothetical protein [Myxococcales bacterium]
MSWLLCAPLARGQSAPSPSVPVVDARRGLHLFPATSWKDGFFLEHTAVPDLGLHPRLPVMYMREPLGSSESLSDRVSLHPSVVLSLNKWVDLGVALPIALWQDASGLNMSATALGDLRLQNKIRIPIPPPFPVFAVSLGVGFPTGNPSARISAGQLSFLPRLVVDWSTLKGRLKLIGNLGGFLAGTGGTCDPTQQPLDPSDPMRMRRLPCPMVCDPETQPIDPMTGRRQPCPPLSMEQAATLSQVLSGLGNHLLYGFGAEAVVSPEAGLRIITEFVGSFSFTNREGRSPLFWDIGLLRTKGNAWCFSAMYGRGLTEGSPNHTLMFTVGYAWEHREADKPKKPTISVEIPPIQVIVPPVSGGPPPGGPPAALPHGTPPPSTPPVAPPPGGGAPPSAPPGPGRPEPGHQAPAGVPATPVQQPQVRVLPPATPPKTQTIEIEVPADWWPEKKDDKKGK